jgi:hypothetical protein
MQDPGGKDLINIEGTPTRDDDDSTDSSCNCSNRLLSLRSLQVLFDIADLTDSHDANDRRRGTVLGTTNNGLGLIKSNDSRIVYDPGGIGFGNDNTTSFDIGISKLGEREFVHNPDSHGFDDSSKADTSYRSHSHGKSDDEFVYDPGGDSSDERGDHNPQHQHRQLVLRRQHHS